MKNQPAYNNQKSGIQQQLTLQLGTAVYTALAAMAAAFYLERMAALDMAFQTFHILRTGSIQIQSGRFGAAATQCFPWAAQVLNMPLKAVLMSYSLGHVFYYGLLFGLITVALRQWKWGLVLLLLSTLMTTHTFYWLSEMPQGLAFLVLVLAWLDYKSRLAALKIWEYPFLAVGLVTAFYFHPMVLYAMVFCSIFFLTSHSLPAGRRTLYLLALAFFAATAVVKYKILPLDWYDAMAMERSRVFSDLWPNWFDIQSNRDFLRWCISDYYMIPALILLNTGFYLWKKHWLKAALAVLAPVAFILLVNVPFHQGDRQFYLENLYLPLAVFVAVPLVFDVMPEFLSGPRMVLAVAVLATAGLLRIYRAHESWTNRLQWEQAFLDKTAGLLNRKLVLSEKQAPMDTLMLSWGSAYEFIVLSSLEQPDSARCILIDEAPERFDSLLTQRRLFLGEFQNYAFDALPQRYFHPIDTAAYVRY